MSETITCDWCGKPFTGGQKSFPGFDNKPTHRKCQREALKALRAWRYDEYLEQGKQAEPFIDWPNGQGTYD